MSLLFSGGADLPSANRHRKRRSPLRRRLPEALRRSLYHSDRSFPHPAHGYELYRHIEGLALPSDHKYLRHESDRPSFADAPGRRGWHLAVLSASGSHCRTPYSHNWMRPPGFGFNLPTDHLFRLGAGGATALTAHLRAPGLGAFLANRPLAGAVLGILPAGPRHVGQGTRGCGCWAASEWLR